MTTVCGRRILYSSIFQIVITFFWKWRRLCLSNDLWMEYVLYQFGIFYYDIIYVECCLKNMSDLFWFHFVRSWNIIACFTCFHFWSYLEFDKLLKSSQFWKLFKFQSKVTFHFRYLRWLSLYLFWALYFEL